jgi:hypothetical protein
MGLEPLRVVVEPTSIDLERVRQSENSLNYYDYVYTVQGRVSSCGTLQPEYAQHMVEFFLSARAIYDLKDEGGEFQFRPLAPVQRSCLGRWADFFRSWCYKKGTRLYS